MAWGSRAGRIVVVAGFVLGASSLPLGRSTAQTAPAAPAGLGQAQAQMAQIDPRSAQLSFGVRFGPTVTDHRNQVARASAQSTDYGLIGSALTAQGCSGGAPTLRTEQLPQRLRADSRTPADATEKSVQEGPITQSVLANDSPFAQATSRLADLPLPGILRLTGAYDRTTSGVDEEGHAFATAEVEIGQLSLAGIVELRGLRWEAEHRAGDEPTGRFSLSGASVAGTPLPTHDPVATIAAVNEVLGTLGLVLGPPVAHLNEGVLFVDPLSIGITPNATRDQVAGALFAAIQPVREQVFGALLESVCDSAAAITVLDILLGSFSGGGSLTLQLGGVQAVTRLVDGFEGLGEGGRLPQIGGPLPTTPRPAGVSGPTAPRGPTVGEVDVAAPDLPAEPVSDDDTASDGALAVGLATVALGLLLVEGDRRKMRRATAALDPSGLEAP